VKVTGCVVRLVGRFSCQIRTGLLLSLVAGLVRLGLRIRHVELLLVLFIVAVVGLAGIAILYLNSEINSEQQDVCLFCQQKKNSIPIN
jgi:hypothetical protein